MCQIDASITAYYHAYHMLTCLLIGMCMCVVIDCSKWEMLARDLPEDSEDEALTK